MTHRDVSGASQWPPALSVINSLCPALGWPTKLSPLHLNTKQTHSNVYMWTGCAFIDGREIELKNLKENKAASQSKWRFGRREAITTAITNIPSLSFSPWPEILLPCAVVILIFWQTELLFIHFLFWLCAGQRNLGGCECKFFSSSPLSSDTMTAVSAVTRAKWGEEQSSIQGYEFLISGGSAAPTAGLQ